MDRTYRVGDELHEYAVVVYDPKFENSAETEYVIASSPTQAKHLARQEYQDAYGTPYGKIEVLKTEVLG